MGACPGWWEAQVLESRAEGEQGRRGDDATDADHDDEQADRDGEMLPEVVHHRGVGGALGPRGVRLCVGQRERKKKCF